MRKSDKIEIQNFLDTWELEHLAAPIYDLCMKLYTSGWVDGGNDYIDEGKED